MPSQEAQRGLSVGQDRRERLIQLVRERGGQLADRRDAREVRQLVSAALRLELRELALGDIGPRHDGAALRYVQRYHGERVPALAARCPIRVLEREPRARPVQHGLHPRERIDGME